MDELPFPPLRADAALRLATAAPQSGADCEPCWGFECALPFLIPSLTPAGSAAGRADSA